MDDEPEYPRDHGRPFDKANGPSSQLSSSIEGGRQRRRKGQAAPPDPRSPQAQITGPPRDGDRRRNGGPARDHNDTSGGVNSPVDEHGRNPRRNTPGNRCGGRYSRQPTWGQPQGFMYGYPNSYGLMPPHMPQGLSPYPPMNYHSYMAPPPPPPPPPAATAPAATAAPAAARTTEVGTSKGKNLDDEVQQLKEGHARFIHEKQAEKEATMRREIEAGVAREFEEQARRLVEEQALVLKELENEMQKARFEAEAAARERLEASERQKRDWEKQVEEFAEHTKHEMEKIQREREKSQRDMERREAERLANEEKRTAEVVAAAQSVEEERLQLARETTSAKEELFELQTKIREEIRAEEAERRAVFEDRLLREVKEANASSAVTGESIKRKVEQLQRALNEGKSAVPDALKLADEAKLAEDATKTAEWATQRSKFPETPPSFVQYQEVDPVLQASEVREPAEQPPLFSEEHVEDRGGAGSNTEDNDDDVPESSSSGSEQLVDYDREAKEA
ncbi:uncharacterized protein E0L32_001713 [Thyridium curvatum]|uniref:Uncharacterized protein n=1 Tax=Thyridium curvatum TaxID=1093900 RepID=A0A507ANC6_9PEZI|nr:uncharacterized protein E0L32_001486 [Thyridium curvatum]XP_030990964.1 uncharacterized protein E0L32_001713 [Thyridium curvatum]TPX09026.1 hypothetical protein E0L32_001486 [Thyridium curvatum]TPX09253.1 hypothetical protein E0L32_001713 [Thyridium curvatum]